MSARAMSVCDFAVRLVAIALRKYTTHPSMRLASARMLMTSAIRRYAMEASASDAAVVCSETIASVAQGERVDSAQESVA